MKKKILVNAMMAMGCIAATNAYSQFIAPVTGDAINLFVPRLGLTTVGPLNTGLSVAERRSAVNLFNGTAASLNANTTATMGNLSGSLAGSHSGYLYRVLSGDLEITNNLELGSGNSINPPNTTATPNHPLLLDLGDRQLNQTTGTLQTQGAVFVSTVNSAASSAGLLMNGTGALTVNTNTTGRISTQQLIGGFKDEVQHGLTKRETPRGVS